MTFETEFPIEENGEPVSVGFRPYGPGTTEVEVGGQRWESAPDIPEVDRYTGGAVAGGFARGVKDMVTYTANNQGAGKGLNNNEKFFFNTHFTKEKNFPYFYEDPEYQAPPDKEPSFFSKAKQKLRGSHDVYYQA